MVRQSSGSMPASYAATRARSTSPCRGSGSASAVTMTSWSALATTTRSTGSSSSAVRRSTVTRSSTSDDPGEATRRRRRCRRPAAPGRRRRRPCGPALRDFIAVTSRPALAEVAGVATAVDGDHDGRDGVVVAGPVLGARAGVAARALVALRVVLVVAPARHHEETRPDVGEAGERLRGGGDVLDEHPVDGGADDSPRRAPSGGRRRCGTSRRAAARARSESPSSCSVTSAPRPRELGGEGGEPVGLVAADVRDAAQSRRCLRERAERGDRGRELADVVQVGVDAQDRVGAVHGEAVRRRETPRRPSARAGRAARRRPGWSRAASPGTRTRPPLVMASITKGAALDRSGSMVTSTARTVPGATVQRVVARLDLDAVLAQARRRSSRCGGARAREGPRGERRCPRRTPRRRAAAPRRTGSTRRRRSRRTHPGRDRCRTTVKGSVPRPPSSTSTPRPRRASMTPDIGRVRACGSPSKVTGAVREGRHRRDEAHHRAGETAVDDTAAQGARASPSSAVRRCRRGSRAWSGPRPSARCRASAGRVVRRRDRRPGAASTRARLVSDFEPGQLDPRVDRTARRRRGPQVEAMLRACLHAPRH